MVFAGYDWAWYWRDLWWLIYWLRCRQIWNKNSYRMQFYHNYPNECNNFGVYLIVRIQLSPLDNVLHLGISRQWSELLAPRNAWFWVWKLCKWSFLSILHLSMPRLLNFLNNWSICLRSSLLLVVYYSCGNN